MDMTIIKKCLGWTVIIGTISLSLSWFMSFNLALLIKDSINGIEFYRIDLAYYTTNLSNTWDSFPATFNNLLPPRQWDSTGTWDSIFNNIAYVFDWLYFPINLLLFFIRMISWFFVILLALMGIETAPAFIQGETAGTFIDTFVWVSKNLMIPYI